MDTDMELRQITFDERYKRLYGCYPNETEYEDCDGSPLDKNTIKEIEKDRTHQVRLSLGWDKY